MPINLDNFLSSYNARMDEETRKKVEALQVRQTQQAQQRKKIQQKKSLLPSVKQPKEENGFKKFADKYIVAPQESIYKHTLAPIEKKAERFLTSMNDGITYGQFKKNLDGGKKIGLDAPKFVQEAASAPKTKFDKAIDTAGEFAGAAAPLSLSYKAVSPILNPVLRSLPQVGKLGLASKLVDSSVRGASAMSAYGATREGIDEVAHPNDANFAQRANRVKTDALYGAIGDPLFRLGGMAFSKGMETAANSTMKSLLPNSEQVQKALLNNAKSIKGDYALPKGGKNPFLMNDLLPKGNEIAKPGYVPSLIPKNIPKVEVPKVGGRSLEEILANPIGDIPEPVTTGDGTIPKPLNINSPEQPLKAGRDFEAITSSSSGNGGKLLRADSLPKNPFDNVPYQAGDPLPDTSTHIGSKTEKTLPSIAETANKGYIKTVDNLHRLNQFDTQVEKVLGRDLKSSESTHTLGLNSRGSDMISKQILTENMVNKNGDAVGQSLKEITMKVPKGKLKSFEDYLVNQHAITRMERGEKVFPNEMKMSPDKSRAIVANYEAVHPEFKTIAKEYYDYNKNLGQHWLVDEGILSKEQWNGYLKSNPNYVPNNRVFSDIERPLFYGAKKGFGNQANPMKKAVGSQRKIVSPIESTIEHTAQYVKTAKRNEVMKTLINNIKQDPEAFKDWAEIMPTEKGAATFLDSVENKLKEEGIEGVLEEFNKAFDQKPDLTKGNIVTGIINGQKVHVKVNDPYLLDALTNLQPKAQNIVIHSLGQVTRVMKNLTTGINPVFSLTRNIFRDIPTAFVNSKSTNNPLVFSKDLVGSIVSVIKNDELYRSFKAVGGGHSSPISSDVNLLAQSKRSILPQKGIKPLLGKGMGALENLNNAVEAAPRLAEFKRFAGDSYDSKMKALYEANDVTVNFNKYGNVAKEVDAVVPYFNAAVQGLDKTARVFFSPKATAAEKAIAGAKAFTAITIPSVLMFAVNHNNPDYQKVSNYIKDTNLLIPKGDGTFYKIPKPRELGVVFGSDVERVLRSWADQDPKAFQDFGTNLWNNFKPPVRSILAPINDLRANKNFMDAPIVPGDLANVSPQYQYDSKTSEVSKKVGGLLGFSPMKADYLAKSYGGIIGELGIPATTKNTSIGNTLKQKVTVDPVFSNDLQRRFYDEKTKLDNAHNDLMKQGIQSPELNEPLRRMFSQTSTQMGKVRKQMKQVQNDQELSADQRLEQLRKLQDFINQMAERASKDVR